jgi:hypothetical protein
VVIFLFLFFWTVVAVFAVRGLLKARGRRR